MQRIRPETEVDRTQAALAAEGLSLPLSAGVVEITADPGVGATPVGQRLLTVLVNELARMKGVVSRLHVVGLGDESVLPGIPLDALTVPAGLHRLVAGLNDDASRFRAEVTAEPAADPTVRVHLGSLAEAHLSVAADGWRALLGRFTIQANWAAAAPYGGALAAALAAAEVFKRILLANGAVTERRLVTDLAYSAFDYRTDDEAAAGPDVSSLDIGDVAVAGCGAGGTAALYVLSMQPGLTGEVTLIEPGRHKLSNVNRYLMVSAGDVHGHRHKLATVANHLALFGSGLRVVLHPKPWERLDHHPWPLILSTVDTVEARWAIQARAQENATILDAAVMDMLYVVLRVERGGWCLECKHPYDAQLGVKQRAARWGQDVETVLAWSREEVTVTRAMLERLATVQNRPLNYFAELEGRSFSEVPALIECGQTALRTDVPSQAPVLPIATTAAGVLLAAEIAKEVVAPEATLHNWVGHDLGRAAGRPRLKWRPALKPCPRHT